jgi:hypothetical protein
MMPDEHLRILLHRLRPEASLLEQLRHARRRLGAAVNLDHRLADDPPVLVVET